MIAFGTAVAQFFVVDPLLRPMFPPVGYGTKNNFLSDVDRKCLNLFTGKLISFIASFNPFALDAIPDRTDPAKYGSSFGKASVAEEVFRC
jgi:hypothetical protein